MINSDSHGMIIGAGIAGIATAIFARELGIGADLYERSAEILCDDHLLWIAPNGLHLLAELGVLDQVLQASVAQEGMIFATKNLIPVMTLTGDSLRRSCGYPIVAVRRRDLWQALERRLKRCGGDIHFGHAAQQIEYGSDGVVVHFAGESQPVVGPWVIGADGMGSKVRTAIDPGSAVEYQGIRTWLGKSETPVARDYVGRTIEAWGRGIRFVLTSLDGQTVHFSALERSTPYESNGAPIRVDTLARLQRLFRDFHPHVVSILEAADPHSLMRCNFGVVSGLKEPFRGRIALIGDAAHGMPPNMGQGASLGLEDALWITKTLKGLREDPESAFRAYAQGRRRRVDEMRFLANAMNGLFQPEKRWACLTRDFIAALIPDRLTALRMGQLYQPAWPPVPA
jgi:2-polyprenyl-6-methoxyphenol hydroxylase-like FAD-dependent oxidoreductase